MRLSVRYMTAVLLLIGSASTASAQSCWYYGECNLKLRGYYGTPYDGGPQYGSGGGDQYGYGPAYSYKHRQGRFQLRRPASFDGSGTDIIGFAPAAEHKKVRLNIPLGRSPLWLKVKNPKAPAVKREAEEDWGRSC